MTVANPTIYQPLSLKAKEIRLITLCHDAEPTDLRYTVHVVDIEQSPEYYALSYAWGAPVPDFNLRIILIDDIVFKIRPTLFHFLSTMAKYHREKSLWVDTICIDQANVQERNHQVSLMGEIYREANEVYAWLGPGDDDTIYAIEHIKTNSPQTPFDENVFSMCVEKLLKFTYWTRRWVIQEFALARRLILVCGDDQIDWYDLVESVSEALVSNDSLALSTLVSFKDVRSLYRKSIPLLELMHRFHTSRCSVLQDRAYALRSIASNGHRLMPDYSESKGDFHFRLLSTLPLERVLPESYGYRWPHHNAAVTRDLFDAKKDVLLDSLKDDKDDRLYVALEYIGRIVKAVLRPEEDSEFAEFTHEILLDNILKENLLGNNDARPGDLVYTLQTSPASPEGFYVAFRPGLPTGRIVSMLIYKPNERTLAYWSQRKLSQHAIAQMDHILCHGMIACSRNLTAKSFAQQSRAVVSMVTRASERIMVEKAVEKDQEPEHVDHRILCHISRRTLILLWLIDVKKCGDFLQCEPICANGLVSSLECDCAKPQQSATSTLFNDENYLEILPSFWSFSSPEDCIWDAASTGLWLGWRNEPTEHTLSITSEHESSTSSKRSSETSPPDKRFQFDMENYRRPQSPRPISFEDLKVLDPENIDFYDNKRTELSYAAGEGMVNFVDRLLADSPYRIRTEDKTGRCPLSWAAGNGHDQVVQSLLSTGKFNINAADRSGQTPLYWASKNGRLRVVEMLLNAVATVKVRNSLADPLYAASEGGHLHIVQLLLKYGGSNNKSNRLYGRPLTVASAKAHLDIVIQLFEAGAEINAGKDGYTALEAASAHGHRDIALWLLKQGADIDLGGHFGSPLIAASQNGHFEVVDLLLQHGADVEVVGPYHNALQAASDSGHLKVVQRLLQHGVEIDDAKPGGSAIYHASCKGHHEIVRLLLDRGADVNAGEESPVHAAVESDRFDILQTLIDSGANVEGGFLGQTALYRASQHGRTQMVRLLLEWGADANQGDLWRASKRGYLEVIQLLLDYGMDIEAVEEGRNHGTALQDATAAGRAETVQLLLDRGARADFDDLLIVASEKGRYEVVKLLLERGANANAKGDEYGSALVAAVSQGHVEIVEMLCRHGAGDEESLVRTKLLQATQPKKVWSWESD